ncbi:MAG: 4-hydroxy-tetrahydrodipicolinate reductase [Armatimonadetes bacterium]|nr:4-hydroxy-tetrahydrodipicolinate reductase [Armatimonadota bacterium]
MVKIAVAGVRGRMGSRIATLVHKTEGLELAGAFEVGGHPDIGKDIGTLLGLGSLGVNISDNIEQVLETSDVVIDFTSPAPTIAHVKAAVRKGKAMVIGTTGFSPEELTEFKGQAAMIPCVFASNMSLGINLLLKVVADVAKSLGEDYDIEIVEAHHRMKKDAPSGTALALARSLANAMGWDLQEVANFSREGMIGERKKQEIGIQTIRAGDIVGEHTVLFGGMGERIEISHRASSRETFARGALRAALWIKGKPIGIYDMQDVLGLK